MANSPVPDQSEDFIKSGMRLITDPRSDKYLHKVSRNIQPPERPKKKRVKCLLTDSDQTNTSVEGLRT